MAGGGEEGGKKGLFGHGLSGRKLVHAGKYAAGATLAPRAVNLALPSAWV